MCGSAFFLSEYSAEGALQKTIRLPCKCAAGIENGASAVLARESAVKEPFMSGRNAAV